MKFKLPHLPQKFRVLKAKPHPKRLQATARRAAPSMEDYAAEEPATRFSTAFIIVLVLHLVAVGGVYAFKSIRANRQTEEALLSGEAAKPAQRTAPSEAAEASPVQSAPPAKLPTQAISAPAGKVYHVKANDTIQKIAAAAAITPMELADANGLKENARLREGQPLNIPLARLQPKASTPREAKKADEPPARSGTPAAAPKTYIVKKGDTPVAIARNLNVPYDELIKLNKIDDPKKLAIGTILKLPPPKKKADAIHS